MKHWMLLTALICFGSPAVQAAPPEPYVAVFRLTPGAAPTHVLAFQNISTGEAVVVDRIEIANASTMTVTGGQAQYWVYASTQLTHSATAGTHYKYGAALASAPTTIVSASTAPTAVLIEGDSAILTAAQRNALSGVAPLLAPLVVDSDDAATVNRLGVWDSFEGRQAQATPLTLPAGSNRALVIEKRMGAASDFTAGSVLIRIFYWRK